MRKGALVILAGVLLGCAAFSAIYLAGTAHSRKLMSDPQPELAWLKQEFNLGEAEFARVVQLHEAYLPQCARRCQDIEAQNQKLQALLRASQNVTPEIESVILERAKLRALCETEMLSHFLSVSRTMPREQGERYLAWVERQTFLNGQAMEQRHRLDSGAPSTDPAGHHSHH